MVLSNKGGERI